MKYFERSMSKLYEKEHPMSSLPTTTGVTAQVTVTSGPRTHMSAEERNARIDLAAFYRLAAIEGWDELLFTHISARIPGAPEHILFHPTTLLFEEVTASRIHKLDAQGDHVVSNDEPPHKFAVPTHMAIYDAFPQAQCVVHLHTKWGIAVAMQDQGLINGNQYALWLGPIGYHPYEGLVLESEEAKRLVHAFGSGQVVLQKGHAFILWGRSIPEAYMLTFLLNRACEVQIMSGASSIRPYVPPPDIIDLTHRQAKVITDGTEQFTQMTWATLLRKLDRVAPDFRN
jgi:ribulose-5-phosphate 4-epimerase/fuculose-1-phosphate aldolase